MEVFALEYYKHNKSTGVFKSEDGAYILSFAIMMLHTSLHNPSVKSRTSRKQWVSMNRGEDQTTGLKFQMCSSYSQLIVLCIV